mmetsp:Transcript_970/g.3406  ORF Transcript_970/g.3406 Transcript_970/m.3406 type:complete len:85 (-) Transcript_970:486-740(-)
MLPPRDYTTLGVTNNEYNRVLGVGSGESSTAPGGRSRFILYTDHTQGHGRFVAQRVRAPRPFARRRLARRGRHAIVTMATSGST